VYYLKILFVLFVFTLPITSSFAQSDLDVYVDNMVRLLTEAKNEYANDNTIEAKRLAMEAYIDNYEYLEDPIDAYDEILKDDIEITLREKLQEKMRNNESSSNIAELIDQILKKLKTATEVVPELSQIKLVEDNPIQPITETIDESNRIGGGCLIATATYGSELAPQVQQLRELRDYSLLQTKSGTSFINTFNDVYYSFSPYIADYERENYAFKELVKLTITPMISSLSILNYVDLDSENSVLGYGISLILLNLTMYVGIPIVAIIGIRKKF
jgi:hypothetical protein